MPKVRTSKFLKAEDVNDGDILTFVDAGEYIIVDFGKGKGDEEIFQIKVELPDGEQKLCNPNTTSKKLLKKAFGDNSDDAWGGKQVIVRLVKQLSFGEMADVLILEPHNPE